MKTSLARTLFTLVVAATTGLLAGCLEQPRPTVRTAPPEPPAAAPVSDAQVVVRPNPAGANLSAPIVEIARLHQAGLDESVVKAFVEKSTNHLTPTADELIYLKDIGVSPRIVTALIQQTARMREQAAAAPPAPAPVAAVNAVPARPNVNVAVVNPPPAPVPAPVPAAVAPAAQRPVVEPAPQVVVLPQPVQAEAAAPVALPQAVSVFYEQLRPYGTWVQVAEYGWCWQPSVAVATAGWRPYFDRGRWLYTDNGWYWQSDYAWGWAPFHYGRWTLHPRHGWLWVPDTTWGPAWVVWRSSAAYCGWAPLPPGAVFVAGRGMVYGGENVAAGFDFGLTDTHYSFVPFGRFCDRNPGYFGVAPALVLSVYTGTTVINNIQINNNVIINHGVPAERVALLTRSEVRKISVREASPNEPGGVLRLDKLEKSGNEVVIYRPPLNPGAPVKAVALTNSKGETRTELVPAGATVPQTIAGRPVYDKTSTGVPVLTGYTTEPSAGPGRPTHRPGASAEHPVAKPNETNGQPVGVTGPNTVDNSLFRPLTPPQPVTSTAPPLTAPTAVAPSHPFFRPEAPKPVGLPSRSQPIPAAVQPVAPPRPTVTLPTPTPTYQPQPQPVAPAAPRTTTVITPTSQPAPTPASSPTPVKTEPDKKK
jgi:hypothetical protein